MCISVHGQTEPVLARGNGGFRPFQSAELVDEGRQHQDHETLLNREIGRGNGQAGGQAEQSRIRFGSGIGGQPEQNPRA